MTIKEFVDDLKELGYSGVYGNVEISITEYGIAWLEDENCIHFVIGSEINDKEQFCTFYEYTIDNDDNWFKKWWDISTVSKSCNIDTDSLREFSARTFVSLASYYGWEQICPQPIMDHEYTEVTYESHET